jgi:hypothetical protein
MGRALCRSDPHLAAMLAIFTKLTAGEAITSWDHPGHAHGRMRRALARLRSVTTVLAARLSACVRWMRRRAAIAWVVVRCRCSRQVWTAVNPSAVPRDPSDPGRYM